MNQRGRVERLVTTPVATLLFGQLVKLVVHDRQEPTERVRITGSRLEQKLTYSVVIGVDPTTAWRV